MKRQSKKGALAKRQRRASKVLYCKNHGEMEEDHWFAPCQLCQERIQLEYADPSHIEKRWKTNRDDPDVLNYICRCCHDWYEGNKAAVAEVLRQGITCATPAGARCYIIWPKKLQDERLAHRRKWYDIGGQNPF